MSWLHLLNSWSRRQTRGGPNRLSWGAGLRRSCRQLTPFGQGSGAVFLEDAVAVAVTVLIEMNTDRGVNGGKISSRNTRRYMNFARIKYAEGTATIGGFARASPHRQFLACRCRGTAAYDRRPGGSLRHVAGQLARRNRRVDEVERPMVFRFHGGGDQSAHGGAVERGGETDAPDPRRR